MFIIILNIFKLLIYWVRPLDCRPHLPRNKNVMTQKSYIVDGKEYRFTEQYRGYIRLEINNRLDMKTTFFNWAQVEEFINNLKNDITI